jgi:hypothetical protein
METQNPNYRGYRFPPEIITYAVWLYHRFCLSFRDVEEILAERGVSVSYAGVRQWCRKFGHIFAKRIWHRRGRLGDTWHLDEGAPRTHSQMAGVRCCTGDEGRPLGAGLQEQAPNPLKLQRSRAAVVSVEEKAGQRSCQVESKEMSVSELRRTCRKGLGDVKTGGIFVNPGLVWGIPVYCPHGVRHEGSMTLLWASVRNVGTCGSDAKGETQMGSPSKSESTEAEHRGGAAHSRAEGSVMGLDRRGCIVWRYAVANLQGEEPHG